ncbi:polyserase-related [Holotrichia oblita]|uniref:Polyserase-related n=1 Tax=Holotrichia oblita TaxID=644536 RepID=A0ACB9SUF7_HOLOL|nr:polyserase-related [Holotrichia oblita]
MGLSSLFLTSCILAVSVAFITPSKGNDRIVGGKAVNITDYPYQVAVYWMGKIWCGGSIIGEDLVVTAAHCIKPYGDFAIRVGSSSYKNGGELYFIDRDNITVHKGYTGRPRDHENDIALLRASQSLISKSSVAKKVKLPSIGQKTNAGVLAKVSGWGARKHINDTTAHFSINYTIRVGSSSYKSGGEVYEIQRDNILVHEWYNSDFDDFDIALLRVSQSLLREGSDAKMVKLPSENQITKAGVLAKVSGWGHRQQINYPKLNADRDILHAVQVPIVDHSVCTEHYPYGKITDSPSKANDRIVGGQEVDIADYPYQVALYVDGELSCGGSIVNEHLVVTAAHCIHENHSYAIRVGSSSYKHGGEVYQIDPNNIIAHEKFDSNITDYDIALLRVSQSLLSKNSIAKAVKLPVSGQKTDAGVLAKVSGWGDRQQKNFPKFNGNSSDDKLRAVEVPIVEQAECKKRYRSHPITDR